MNDLDALPFTTSDDPPNLGAPTPRRCRRHAWQTTTYGAVSVTRCLRCPAVRDDAAARRGKQSRRLGNDQERRAERVYGWEKIGERGQMTDLRGRLMKVQQKASRRPTPALFRSVFGGLEQTRDGRIPALLLSFVRQGVGTEDFVILRGVDWLDLHGRDEPTLDER